MSLKSFFAAVMFTTASVAAFCGAASSAEPEPNYPECSRRAPGTTLRIMSYNILAERFNKKMRSVPERAPEVAKIIKTIAPDIAGLQETDQPWYPVLSKLIAPYKFAVDPYDTTLCAVIYDSTRFRQIDGGNFAFVTEELRCLRYTVLENIASGKKIIFTNTHWNLKQFSRFANAMLMLHYLGEVQRKYPGVPIICTGDFNCSAQSVELAYFLEQSGFSDALETAGNVFNKQFSSTYSQWQPNPRPRKGQHIDHIIFSKDFQALSAGMAAGEEIYRASDHAPIVADLIEL